MPQRIIKKIKNDRKWQLASMVLVGIIVVAGWLIRQEKLEQARGAPPNTVAITGSPLELSPQSIDDLVAFGKKHPQIVAVSAVTVNLSKNTVHTTFFKGLNPQMELAWSSYEGHRASAVAAYASTATLNARVTSLINGNFVCSKFQDTLNFRFFPDAAPSSPWVCSIAVPPGFDKSGDFVGYLNFFLSQAPTDRDQKLLDGDAIILASAIYKRDILSKVK